MRDSSGHFSAIFAIAKGHTYVYRRCEIEPTEDGDLLEKKRKRRKKQVRTLDRKME
jgi:hypothetical protein